MLSDSEDDIPLSKKWKRAITKEKEAEEDRISALPDSLLLHILSFLSTKEVVRTCSLSKRWEFIWTELSEVDLREYRDGKIRNFVDWVGRMLAMCKGLNKFAVGFGYRKCFASNVNFWVYCAINSKVKDFTLSCSQYNLPQMFYTYSSLTNLNVSYCVMAPRGIIAWGSLKSLSIDGVELLDCVMEKILSGCPVLEVLRLTLCQGLNYLNIYSPNLSTLVIENIGGFRHKYPDISAPYLRVLSIFDDDSRGQFRLSNVSSVVRANLDFYDLIFGNISSMNYIKELLERLQSVKKLELGPQCMEMVSSMEVDGWKLPLSTQRDLTLNVWRHEMSIPSILAMLRASPNLETLHIRGSWVSNEKTMSILDDYEISLENCNLDLVALHLKTVKITEFTEQDLAGKPMLTLIQILLMNAKVLEKMVISVQEDPFESPSSSTSTDSTKIAKKLLVLKKKKRKAKKLLTIPRASPKAVVVLT